jgi:hypothetical protein
MSPEVSSEGKLVIQSTFSLDSKNAHAEHFVCSDAHFNGELIFPFRLPIALCILVVLQGRRTDCASEQGQLNLPIW